MKYVFYFDETFHDRKIVFSRNGSINTLRDDDIDDYLGVFWGCDRKHLNRIDVTNRVEVYEKAEEELSFE